MKKLFLLIPALVLSLVLNAEVIYINTGTADALRKALNNAQSGDIIEMAAGTYVESNSDYIAFTGKAVTVRAAAGAEVILVPKVQIRLKEGARAEFIGIKFDCGHLSDLSLYSNLIATADNTDGKKLILKDCEFYGWAQNNAILLTPAGKKIDSIIINNCHFHDCYKSVLFCEDPNLIGVEINNSTFANVNGTYWAAPIYVPATSGKLVVDHCTFYNVEQADAGSGVVTTTLADATVSNCIFMFPTSGDICATKLPAGGVVKNTLTYNYDNWQPYGHYKTATVTDCVKANPLFKDAANGDFSLYASSPARGAGDDASDLGDPRWAKALTPVAIPTTLVPFDALLSAKASIIQSDPDSIFLKTQSETIKEWAKWNVSVEEDGLYDFTAYAKRTGSDESQKLQIDVLNSTETETLKSNAKTDLPNECTISTGAVNLVAGNTYVIKVFNNYAWAESKLIKVEASYAGGKLIAVPDTLWPVDAIKSERAFVNEAGELRFTDDDHAGEVREQYGKWKISVAKAGNFKFTVSANSDNGHAYELTLRNSAETQDIASKVQKGSSNTPLTFSLDVENLAIGNYVLNIRDTTKHSHGRIHDIAVSYEGGAVTAIPGQLIGEDALLYKSGDKYMIRTEEGYLKSSNNGSPTTEWAVWNITAEAGTLDVTLNLDPVTSSGHNYRVELYDGNELKDYTQELESEEKDAAVHSKGNIALEKTLVIPANGTYTIKLINRTQWSSMILQGITFATHVAPAALVIDEAAEDNSAWVANVDGAAVNVQLKRTFKGGVYNSICVPFEAPMSKIKAAFGNDVELLYLSNVSLSGDILNLEFTAAPDFYQGTPYLIKPSADVVNPEFENVNLLAEEAASTSHTGWVASYRGTFVKKTIPANENNLYLGTDNNLYFSSNPVTIKGLRAYFEVSIQANAIKRARLVTPNNMPTDIEIVESQDTKAVKAIQNGQVIIIRDGKKFNVMGLQVK
ncbi:MAG: DUF5123 domain-containing protein [Paludibacteraceae bacterium]|nr:DUF5123 domain-containing protein [Paludibacteraceae bacterium]